MDMIINEVLPVCLLVLFGTILFHMKFINECFVIISGRLIDFFFLPVALFWVMVNTQNLNIFNWTIFAAATLSISLVFVIIILLIRKFKVQPKKIQKYLIEFCSLNAGLAFSLIIIFFDQSSAGSLIIFLLFMLLIGSICQHIGRQLTAWLWTDNHINIDLTPFLHRNILTLVAGFVGIFFAITHLAVPSEFSTFFELITPAVIPLSLITTGAAFSTRIPQNTCTGSVIGFFTKTILLPGLLFIFLMLLSSPHKVYAVIVLMPILPYFSIPYHNECEFILLSRSFVVFRIICGLSSILIWIIWFMVINYIVSSSLLS